MTASNVRASLSNWLMGARLRTIPLSFGPVLLGSASAWNVGAFNPALAALALVAAVSLQIGVNYANDYSDGIRGTDRYRVGPARLTGSGVVAPRSVKIAALVSFLVAVVTGLVLIVLSGAWSLGLVGLLALWAAWTYTGGTRPYGYRGLGELAAFSFFGPVATAGTVYVQAGLIPTDSVVSGSAMGFFAAAVLLINNLRDIVLDEQAGKYTLAVRIGVRGSKALLTVLLALPFALLAALWAAFSWSLWVALAGIGAALAAVRAWRANDAASLNSALRIVSTTSLAYAALLSAAVVLQ